MYPGLFSLVQEFSFGVGTRFVLQPQCQCCFLVGSLEFFDGLCVQVGDYSTGFLCKKGGLLFKKAEIMNWQGKI